MARWVVIGTKKIEGTTYSRSESYSDARGKRDAWQRFKDAHPDYVVQQCFDDDKMPGDELEVWRIEAKKKKSLVSKIWDAWRGNE